MFWRWRAQRKWGQMALGVWLIASGLLPLLGVSFLHSAHILALLAVVSGILILMQR